MSDRKVVMASVEVVFARMQDVEIGDRYEECLGNNYAHIPYRDIRKWEKIKQGLREAGFTHLPNGDDL